jgi:hypothetical protein
MELNNTKPIRKNHLFMIGIDDYQDLRFEQLRSCKKDCLAIKSILFDKYEFSLEDTKELYNEEATNYNIQNQLRNYVQTLTHHDNLIIYFSGHGGKDQPTEKGFWVPYDAHKINYPTWIANEVILGLIKEIKAHHIVLISDSCFSESLISAGTTKGHLTYAKDYDHYASRWGLASGRDETNDGTFDDYSLFCDTLVDFFTDAKDDFRISKLIEFVKDRFDIHEFQRPVGNRLNDPNHKSGEFIFRITNSYDNSEKEARGNKEFDKILQEYSPSSTFIKKGEYNKSKIGYQLFVERSKITGQIFHFLYLHENINYKKTYEQIKIAHPDIKGNDLIIIAKNISDGTQQYIKNLFRAHKIELLEDFIRICTPKSIMNGSKEKFLSRTNFVIPTFKISNTEIGDTKYIENWLLQKDAPVLVLKGLGGIGKTTLAQHTADVFLRADPNSSVLFIDSLKTVNELNKAIKKHGSISIYNFYEALHEVTGTGVNKINEFLFTANLDVGNFLIVVDGLDEVLSKVQNFDITEFINSITTFSRQGTGEAKIIITCRSYFWDKSKYNSIEIQAVELQPFDESQTKAFFERSFGNDLKKIDRCLSIANDFRIKSEDNGNLLHPYVLDVVLSIVESGSNDALNSAVQDSDILDIKIKSDRVIYQTCYRECLRFEHISIDDQVNFFSYWAIQKSGSISLQNFDRELRFVLNKHIDEMSIEAFKSHPFIQVLENTIQFKYDFFADYFKSIYVSRHLQLESQYEHISDEFLKILCENCWYGSNAINDIKSRVIWNEYTILKCSDIIDQIFNNISKQVLKVKAISGLFNICLACNFLNKGNNIDHNTILIKQLFGKSKNEIVGLHIINFYESKEIKHIRFDFSGLTIKESYIDTYSDFWQCTFDHNTIFDHTLIHNIEYSLGGKAPISLDAFIECQLDDKFKSAFKISSFNEKKTAKQIMDFLRDFFHLFVSNGRLNYQTLDVPHTGRSKFYSLARGYSRLNNKLLPFKETISYMKEEEIVEVFEAYAEVKIQINPKYKNDISRFLNDGTHTVIILKIISDLNNKYFE